jgi:hypothetical protein
MKKIAALFLLLAFSCLTAFSEARPVTLPTGESGFFLSRADMEKTVGDLEAFKLLKADYAVLEGWYREALKKIQQLQSREGLVAILSGSAGALSGFFLGRASK